jgi:hypothetical protein
VADTITAELIDAGLVVAEAELADAMQRLVNEASHETADAIAREAAARLRRQLGPDATGKTEAGIVVRPAYDGNGYVVISSRDPFPNLPLWIEKGTSRGRPGSHASAARPYFYVSAQIEAGAHERRIEAALRSAITVSGLGD